MFDPNANASPVNPLPPVIVILALVIGGTEVMLQLGNAGFIGGPEAVGWRLELMRELGFFINVFDYMRETRTFDWNTLGRFITYPFVHYAAMHAGFAVVMILAIGKAVAEVFHTIAVLVLFFASTAIGAFVYGAIGATQAPLIGAYPAVYGLIGAYTWILWLRAGATGQNRLLAFRLIGILTALRLFYRVSFGGGNEWAADLSGFVTGFALAFVLAPDGRARIGSWVRFLRQR